MNNSGQAVEAIMSYYNLFRKNWGWSGIKISDLSRVLTVIHDDFDIVLGQLNWSDHSSSGRA